jgi:TIR domain
VKDVQPHAKVFLSHVAEEEALAVRLKSEVERVLPSTELFVSSVDIGAGDRWLEKIDSTLRDAKALMILCSSRSTGKPWINFESGAGWSRDVPVIPICHGGLRKDALPYPLSIFQAAELLRAEDCRQLVDRLAKIAGVAISSDFDAAAMSRRLEEPAKRTSEIGVVLCHGQAQWDETRPTVFALARAEIPRFSSEFEFSSLDRAADLMPARLAPFAGLIVGSPWRSRIDPDEVASIVAWVRAGGRLVLLGFELGDLHHGANLRDLSRQFGIDFATDIVGPPGLAAKPYGEPVEFTVASADAHRFTAGLTTIKLADVQTVRCEPGGHEWLRVGHNSVYQPSDVRYRDGVMTQPQGWMAVENTSASWLPVAVQAPTELCGAGEVHALGTWDLLGRRGEFGADNNTLVERLLRWLSGNDH